MLLMLLPFSVLCWSFADDFFMITKEIDIFSMFYKEVNQYYVYDVNPGQLIKKGVEDILNTQNPYTN